MWSSGACVDVVYIVLLHDYTGTVRIQIVVLLTSLGLNSIHIVNTRFLYNVLCVQNENVATGFQKWIAIFENSRFY